MQVVDVHNHLHYLKIKNLKFNCKKKPLGLNRICPCLEEKCIKEWENDEMDVYHCDCHNKNKFSLFCILYANHVHLFPSAVIYEKSSNEK